MEALRPFDLTAAAQQRMSARQLAQQLTVEPVTSIPAPRAAETNPAQVSVAGMGLHLLITLVSLALLAYVVQLQALGLVIAAIWLAMAHWCEFSLATVESIFLGRNFWRWGMILCVAATISSALDALAL